MKVAITVAIWFSVIGCAGKSYQLGLKYEPLTEIKECCLFEDGRLTTILSTVYTGNLDLILNEFDGDSVLMNAAMLHEQEHARRQMSYPGLPPAWFFLYAFIPSFRWSEERVGWEIQIKELVKAGYKLFPDIIAADLSHRYSGPFDSGMVSYEEAFLWASSIINSAK